MSLKLDALYRPAQNSCNVVGIISTAHFFLPTIKLLCFGLVLGVRKRFLQQ